MPWSSRADAREKGLAERDETNSKGAHLDTDGGVVHSAQVVFEEAAAAAHPATRLPRHGPRLQGRHLL